MKRYLIAGVLTFLLIIIVGFFTFFNLSYLDKVEEVSKKYDIDRATIFAVIRAESGFREKVESNKGAVGLMQVLPTTAKWIVEKEKLDIVDYDLKNGEDNIEIGTMYLRYLKNRFRDNIDRTLAAYNAGGTKVDNERWKTIKETREYVVKVKKFRRVYKFLLLWIDTYRDIEDIIGDDESGE